MAGAYCLVEVLFQEVLFQESLFQESLEVLFQVF
jgi:hypothetical protein